MIPPARTALASAFAAAALVDVDLAFTATDFFVVRGGGSAPAPWAASSAAGAASPPPEPSRAGTPPTPAP